MAVSRQTIVEIDAYQPATSSVGTLYFASRGYSSLPADTPAHIYISGRVQQPLLMRRDCFDARTTGGRVQVGYGMVELDNTDGVLDELATYGVAGRRLVQRIGERGAVYPAAYSTVVTAAIEAIEVNRSRARIRVRDRAALVADKPLSTSLYAGTNSLPNGVEGMPADLKGQRKPDAYGIAKNCPLPCCNTSLYIYQASARDCAVDAVFDRALAMTLTAGAAYSSQADMEANAPAAGYYRLWRTSTGTYVRTGSKPTGQLTAHLTEGASSADRTLAQIYYRILVNAGGIDPSEIVTADLTALDTATSSASVGTFASGDETIGEALEKLCSSFGAWWGIDALGRFRIQQWLLPSGTPVLDIREANIGKFELVAANDEAHGVPPQRVNLDYQKAWYVQTDGLDANVSAAQQAFVKQEYRRVTAFNAATAAIHPLAGDLNIQTLLDSEAAAQAEATRVLALRGELRLLIECEVFFRSDEFARLQALFDNLDLGVVVRVWHRRFGCAAGKLLRVAGMQPNLARGVVALTLWGVA